MEVSGERNPVEMFVEHAEKRLSRMEVVLDELRQDPRDQTCLSELKSQFHNLAGTGGAYSFFEVSRHAQEGEALCNHILRRGGPCADSEGKTLRALVAQLRSSLSSEKTVALEAMLALFGSTVEVPSLKVVILEWFDETRKQWVQEVRNAGWPARGASTQEEFFREFKYAPDAVIASADELSRDGFQFLSRLRALDGGSQTVILLIGTLSQFADKVDALRMGADAYFEHQTEFSVVLERLQELLQKRQPRSGSILVVDDDTEQVAFLRAVLQLAGYQVHSCKDPRLFEQELTVARPDLIILDLMLPTIHGADLARYIRQHEIYRSVPIIVLSAVKSADLRAEATFCGGDVQLQKPVTAEVLLHTVSGALANARRRGTVTAIEVIVK
jgi:DNA-binding response OmpR family regulator